MKIMSNREYWIWTEVFVHLHNGVDHCEGEAVECVHCAWMETVFGKKPPKIRRWKCFLCGPIDAKNVEHDTWGEYHTVAAPNGRPVWHIVNEVTEEETGEMVQAQSNNALS